MSNGIDTVAFGKSDIRVTRVGLGGEGILRTSGRADKAGEMVQAALDEGIAYFDSARVYADSEIYLGSVWEAQPERRRAVFQASKSASRDRDGAMRDLEETLSRLHTDRLDLWQIHDVRTETDLAAIEGPGGALSAFVEAKGSGLVRHIGVTGHHDPGILTRAVEQWPVDAVMMPVNPVEGVLGGFLNGTLPAAQKKGLAVIGMKILGAGHYVQSRAGVTADLLIRYALSRGVTVAIVGCGGAAEVAALAQTARPFKPLSRAHADQLEILFEPFARKYAFYRGVI
ncbi:MAG: aldo/keto reductase [Pseudomonadota bacterium]